MSFVKIWIHAVWSTANREPLLTKSIREQLFPYIRENAREKGIYIDFINGHLDHVHCLISLGSEQNISKVIQLLKGESAFWINQKKFVQKKFSWQAEYFAVSVSESILDKVRKYKSNQEEHHKKINFIEEYNQFIKKYELKKTY